MSEKKSFFSFFKGVRTSYDESLAEENKQREYALSIEKNRVDDEAEPELTTVKNIPLTLNEISEFAIEKIKELLTSLNYKTDVKYFNNEGNIYYFEIIADKEDVPTIIGKEGSMINSLQILVNAMTYQKFKEPNQIIIDIDNYKQKKFSSLKSMALKAARNVAMNKERVELRPMSAQERRFIHMIFQNDKKIKSYSIGENNERRVVLEFKNVNGENN